jgi:hypothetical protein
VASSYSVSLDTTALVGNSSGPFSVQLVFTDGSGVGDANNLVTVSNVQFGGGAALGNPFVFGGVAGSLETGIAITDSSFFNFFLEGFSAGNQLNFLLTLTPNDDLTGTPDRLVFYLIDAFGNPIPTLAPYGDYFWGVDIHSTGPVFDAYASDTSRTSISIPAPIISVPEPGMISLLGASTALAALRRRCLSRRSEQ